MKIIYIAVAVIVAATAGYFVYQYIQSKKNPLPADTLPPDYTTVPVAGSYLVAVHIPIDAIPANSTATVKGGASSTSVTQVR